MEYCFTFICSKIESLKRPKINEKEAGDGPFLLKIESFAEGKM